MAEFDSVFQGLLEQLALSAEEATQTPAVRRYLRYVEEAPDRHTRDFLSVLPTDALDSAYPSARASTDPRGKLAAMQIQHTVISAIRRDMGMRYRTRIRAMAHGTSRVLADASETGPLIGTPVEYVKATLEAATGL